MRLPFAAFHAIIASQSTGKLAMGGALYQQTHEDVKLAFKLPVSHFGSQAILSEKSTLTPTLLKTLGE